MIASYILKASFAFAHMYIMINRNFTWSERVVILVGFAVVLSIILALISECKFVNILVMKINYKSIHNDIWQDTIDYKNGTTLKMTCNNGVYTGVLVAHEENGNNSWFILEDYTVTENNEEYESKNIPYKCSLAINLKDVKRIELFYGEAKDSKVKELYQKILTELKLKK